MLTIIIVSRFVVLFAKKKNKTYAAAPVRGKREPKYI
jgi:hypothetical protein